MDVRGQEAGRAKAHYSIRNEIERKSSRGAISFTYTVTDYQLVGLDASITSELITHDGCSMNRWMCTHVYKDERKFNL